MIRIYDIEKDLEIWWLHDDWMVVYLCNDKIFYVITEMDPAWFEHDSSDCRDGECLICEKIWHSLMIENIGRARKAFLENRAEPYKPEEWVNPIWKKPTEYFNE